MQHDQVHALCLALPGAMADLKWQVDLVYTVGGKMFCCRHSDPAQSSKISFKVDAARFLELTDQPGIQPAPYLARAHWIQLDRPDVLPDEQLTELLRQSYLLVRAKLSKKLRDTLSQLT